MKKRDDKGFSLVELVVVVLILGILSVSVAPQIMKWLDKSKIATDRDNAETLKFAMQTALTDWQSRGGIIDTTADFSLVVNKDGTVTCSQDWTNGSSTESLKTVLDETMAGTYPKVQHGVLTGTVGFQVTVEKSTGKITVTCKAQSVTL